MSKAKFAKFLKIDSAKFEPHPIVNISREDFNLLDAEDGNTTYYILEDDGTITIRKGVNE